MKLQTLLVSAALQLVASSAQADLFSFQLRVDATRPTCAEQKADIQKTLMDAGEAFGRDVKELRVSCLQEFVSPTASGGQHRAYLVGVRVEARSVAPVYAAHWGMDSSPAADTGISRGFFADADECLAAERNERAVFERLTGLVVQFSSCSPDEVRSGVVLSLSSFGAPRTRLRATDLSPFFSRDQAFTSEELGWVRGYMASQGADIRAIRASRVLYFSEKRIEVRMRRMGHWYDPSQCQAQLGEAQAIFAGHPATLSCQMASLDPTITWSEMRVLHSGLVMLRSDSGDPALRYASFAECRRFLPEVLDDARASNAAAFLGGLCVPVSLDPSRFTVELWWRY